jgi:hypothetical protein
VVAWQQATTHHGTCTVFLIRRPDAKGYVEHVEQLPPPTIEQFSLTVAYTPVPVRGVRRDTLLLNSPTGTVHVERVASSSLLQTSAMMQLLRSAVVRDASSLI